MNVGMKVFGHAETASRFVTLAATVGPKTQAVIHTYGMLLQTKVQAHASGRPGPNAPTGDYRRSIHVEFSGESGSAKATVGTNKPQARRLEFGFVGIDSLGRHYSQPPYPHFGPALDEIEPDFLTALAVLAVPR